MVARLRSDETLARGLLPLHRLTASPALSGVLARSVRISPDGRRVAYLRAADDDRYRLDLWLFTAADGRTRRLVDAARFGAEAELSSAAAARRERQRTAGTHGILHLEWTHDGGALFFECGDALHFVDPDAGPDASVRTVARGGGWIDPRLSPRGRYVAFVRGQNLHVLDLERGEERALTADGGGTIHNGEAEFVAQEEMGEPHGYWWAPDESLIAFKRYDESRVPLQRRFEVRAESTEIIEQRYPVAGGPNVSLRLGVVAPAGGPVRWIDLGPDDDIYLPRVDWLPDSRSLAFQRETRDQKRLELIRVELAGFTQTLLRRETASTWIELHHDLRFLAAQPAFVWAADREGRKHLELVGLDGVVRHRLTAGDWQVDRLLAIDEDSGLLYVAGDAASAFESHVYRLRLDGIGADAPQRLSEPGGWHEAHFPQGERPRVWVDAYDDPSTPPRLCLRDLEGRRLAWIEENRLDAGHPYHPFLPGHCATEFGTIPADDGTPLNYALIRPPGFDPSRRYPVLVEVYGGPAEQMVSRRWGRLLMQAMAQRGLIVFALDNRGSARRGRAFSDAIHGRLGDIEVRDQLAGLRWLARQPGVDAGRVGVFGWSYGGYMTLMLLAKAPRGTFAAGVAVAPVTRYELYDTYYTERYLGTPQANPEGYAATSVFGVLDDLHTPLLLVHGMADDNVLFVNTTALMSALQARGKAFRLMTYPGGKHGLADRAMTDHVHRLIADYFDEMLAH